jgi:hypothetical protein
VKLLLAAAVAGVWVTTASAAVPALKHTSAGTAAAKGSLLTLKDLGKGWTAIGSGPPSLQLACNGYQPSVRGLVEIGSASSPNFSGGNGGPFVSQVTSVLAGARQASNLWSHAVKPGLISCVAQSLESITSRGIKVKILAQGALKIPNVADRTAAYRVSATLSSSKQTIKTYFDIVLVESGQTITEVTFSSLVNPVPANFEHGVAVIIARRLGSGPAA